MEASLHTRNEGEFGRLYRFRSIRKRVGESDRAFNLNLLYLLLSFPTDNTVGELTMATIEIDTERGWDDVEQQIMDMETHELLSIYDMFVTNPTVFSTVGNELMYRREHEQQLEHEGQIGEIEQRFR